MANIVDLTYTRNGDFEFLYGDFKDTDGDTILAIKQMIRDRVCSLPGDWRNYPSLTSNLDVYLGGPNNEETAKKVKEEVISALTKNNFLTKSSLSVKVFPLSIESLGILVKVSLTIDGEDTSIYEIFSSPIAVEMNPKIIAVN